MSSLPGGALNSALRGVARWVAARSYRGSRSRRDAPPPPSALQAALAEVRGAVCELPGVAELHELQIWSLNEADASAVAHVTLTGKTRPHELRRELERMLVNRFGLAYAYIQPAKIGGEDTELPSRDEGCSVTSVSIDQLLGERLASLRTSRGMTQSDLAVTLGVPASWIEEWERGDRRISVLEMMWLTAALDTEATALWDCL